MTNVDGQQTYEKNIRRNLSRLIVMFAIGLLLSLVLIFFIPDEILKMHPPAIVILLFKSQSGSDMVAVAQILVCENIRAAWPKPAPPVADNSGHPYDLSFWCALRI
jgi:hypothetical protein